MLIWEMIIGFIIALIIYNIVHHFFIVRPIDNGNRITLNVLDNFINNLDKKLDNTLHIIEKNNNSMIWGRNIYDYEYVLKFNNKFDERHMKNLIINEIDSFNNSKHFNHDVVMTDFFTRRGLIHIDLAYLLNSSTYEYVLDMKKLDK